MKFGLVAGIFMACAVTSFGQVGTGGSLGKFYYGGGLSFGAGTNSYGYRYSYITLLPLMGYRVTPDFSVGSGVNWQHYSYPDNSTSYDQYGISPFMRYNFNQLFFQTEYDILSSPYYDSYGTLQSRKIYNRLLFGIGFTQRFSDTGRGAISAMGMYDVLYKLPSAFTSPVVFRVFVTF